MEPREPVVLHHASIVYGDASDEEQAVKILGGKDGLEASGVQLMCGIPLLGQQAIQGWRAGNFVGA